MVEKKTSMQEDLKDLQNQVVSMCATATWEGYDFFADALWKMINLLNDLIDYARKEGL